MILSAEVKEYLEEQSRITGAVYMLCDGQGRIIYGTSECEVKENKIQAFYDSEKEEKLQKEFHFLRMPMGDESAVLLTIATQTPAVFGRLAKSGILHIAKAADPDSSIEGICRKLLTGEPEEQLLRKATEKGLKADTLRTVFLVRFPEDIPEEAGEILKNISPEAEKDLAIPLDGHTLAYLRCGRGAKEEKELAKFAKEALAMLNMELFADVRIAYGMSVSLTKMLHQSYKAAYMAMEVAKIFYEDRRIASYSRLGIGRLIYELPQDLCALFLKEIFGENRLCNLDEEEQSLIERFFANNLNISETARDLFMHRNTLTFRLEKLQKHTGLDIRKFEDAMTLKLGMMVARFLQEREA
ncbi:MAG: helix-turn-helix domain-containing protein [Lachnospiraceae bacterium]|nr:helix-turn-helix domain-containing protein [Lachnospiraceae bacterium]